jgi:hypothetical protein
MKPSFKSIITAAAVAGIVSAVVNSILYFVFHAAGVIRDDVFVQENQPLALFPVLISSLQGLYFIFYAVTQGTVSGTFLFSLLFCSFCPLPTHLWQLKTFR